MARGMPPFQAVADFEHSPSSAARRCWKYEVLEKRSGRKELVEKPHNF
jgi:hypothetical protein